MLVTAFQYLQVVEIDYFPVLSWAGVDFNIGTDGGLKVIK